LVRVIVKECMSKHLGERRSFYPARRCVFNEYRRRRDRRQPPHGPFEGWTERCKAKSHSTHSRRSLGLWPYGSGSSEPQWLSNLPLRARRPEGRRARPDAKIKTLSLAEGPKGRRTRSRTKRGVLVAEGLETLVSTFISGGERGLNLNCNGLSSAPKYSR
jgi:hypothetical protein